MTRRPIVVVMLKTPRAGCVKTRLGRDIGMVAAAWWFRHQVRRMLRRIRDPRWQIVLAVSPDNAVSCGGQGGVFPADLPRIPQGGGDLGDRMGRIFRSLPFGRVVIIGGDIPGVTRAALWRGIQALGRADAVFGPAEDGGYWLIGLNRVRVPATLFQQVRWSTEYALADTVRSLGDADVAMIDRLRDIDSAVDLRN